MATQRKKHTAGNKKSKATAASLDPIRDAQEIVAYLVFGLARFASRGEAANGKSAEEISAAVLETLKDIRRRADEAICYLDPGRDTHPFDRYQCIRHALNEVESIRQRDIEDRDTPMQEAAGLLRWQIQQEHPAPTRTPSVAELQAVLQRYSSKKKRPKGALGFEGVVREVSILSGESRSGVEARVKKQLQRAKVARKPESMVRDGVIPGVSRVLALRLPK